MLYLGSDHRGFALKEKLKLFLEDLSVSFTDLGAHHLDPKDDYTFYAETVARAVSKDQSSKGILICGSGVGVDIVANKIDQIRASIGKTADQVTSGRADDDMNILVLAADFTSLDEAKEMTKSFLQTQFDHLPRHQKRLVDIKKIEKTN